MSEPLQPRVLLVDDDPASHIMVQDILEPEGYVVDSAKTVDAASKYVHLVAAGEIACRAAILDFHLNNDDATREKETGGIVLGVIREQLGPDFPVIGFSGRTMETHGITRLFADPTKDGVFELPSILANIPSKRST